MDSIKLLEELTQLDGPASFEHEVRAYMKEKMEAMNYEVVQDRLGSIFAVKKSKKSDAPNVMLAGHMDEVGFMITGFTKHGLLKFTPLGGWWSQVMLAGRVIITNTDGSKYTGVISSIAPHLLTPEMMSKPFEIKDMLIDCGFENEDDAKSKISIGSFVTPDSPFQRLGEHRLLSKAFDNRYGCAMALDVLNTIKDMEFDVNLYIGATVQEEVGCRGAKTAAALIKPNFFLAVDASPARDTSGDMDEFGRLGSGFLVRIYDRSMILNPAVRDYVMKHADLIDAKYQYFTSPGGTDAGAVHMSGEGVLSVVIGIPARGIHSHSSIMDIRDYNSAKATILTLLEDLNSNTIKELQNA